MNQALNIEIDALTESVVEVSTGKIFKTDVSTASKKFLKTIHKKMDGNSIGRKNLKKKID